MPEKIPCPVDGCDEVFADEAEAVAHMKEKHRDEFAPAPVQIIPPDEPPADQAQKVGEKKSQELIPGIGMVPPAMLELLDQRMDTRIQAALAAERPELAKAIEVTVTRSFEAIANKAKEAGIVIPGVTDAPGEGGVIDGSPVTPTGAAFLQFLMKQGSGGSDMENLAKTLTQARAISDVLNPPTIWDRVMQNAVLRSLGKAGLVTDSEMKELLEPPKKT